MVTAIINHEVKDYADWRIVFDADAANRQEMGLTITGVYQSVDNPNKITITGEAQSVEAIQKFFDRPDLKATMEMGGVISKPEVKLLNKA